MLEKAIAGIAKRLGRLVEKGELLATEKDIAISRIVTTHNISDLSDMDIVIEAASEDLDVKKSIFERLDAECKGETVFASNTSSISITKIASFTRRPELVVGLHFFNPAPVMELVELIEGLRSSIPALKIAEETAKAMGKTVIAVKDAPGFVVNRVLLPMINEAVFLLAEGIADAQSIDTAMRLGASHPMGPLSLADLIGLDTCLHIMETLHADLGDDKYRPCPLLRSYVQAGLLGRKSGEGFFKY
jgi:3-hydroxybutyryl-CoA dehydrogenase